MSEKTSSQLPQEFATFLGVVPNPIVQPGIGGPIDSSGITDNDVLLGRGAFFDRHPGNIQFRKIAVENRKIYYYHSSKKIEKTFCGAKVVAIIRNLNPSGRFLSKNNEGYWEEVGDVKARKKAVQALRDELRYRTHSAKRRSYKKKRRLSATQSENEAERGSTESFDSANDYSEESDSSKECEVNANVSDASTYFNMDEEDFEIAAGSPCEKSAISDEQQDLKATIDRASEDNIPSGCLEGLGEEDMISPFCDISSDDSEFADFSRRVKNIIYSSGFEPDEGGSRVSGSSTASESLGSQLSFDLLGLSRARIIDPRLHCNYENLAIYTSGYCVRYEP